MTITIWYRPEYSREPHHCFCSEPSIGRTRYYNGLQYRYVYQCRPHLPLRAQSYDVSVVERAA